MNASSGIVSSTRRINGRSLSSSVFRTNGCSPFVVLRTNGGSSFSP